MTQNSKLRKYETIIYITQMGDAVHYRAHS